MSDNRDQHQAITRRDLRNLIAVAVLVAGAFVYLDDKFDAVDDEFDAVRASINDLSQRVARIEGLIDGLRTSDPDVLAGAED